MGQYPENGLSLDVISQIILLWEKNPQVRYFLDIFLSVSVCKSVGLFGHRNERRWVLGTDQAAAA